MLKRARVERITLLFMEATEVTVDYVFNLRAQLRIPVWQRRYSWGRPEWAELWGDIERTVSSGEHFVGSLVVLEIESAAGSPRRVDRFAVVDGQQRLTTLSVLFAAIRDRITSEIPGKDEAQKTFDLLTQSSLENHGASAEYQAKLVLQESDQIQLEEIAKGHLDDEATGSLIDCYRYFSDRIEKLDQDECERYWSHIRSKFSLAHISLGPSDNAHRIFQTLNAGGKPLKQSDLVRNFFFLLLSPTKGEEFYDNYWKPMEDRLEDSGLESFFSAWATNQGKSGSAGSLFSQFRELMSPFEGSEKSVLDYGVALSESAQLFEWIIKPDSCDQKLLKDVLNEVKTWGNKAAEGLLLQILLKFQTKVISREEAAQCIELILSFFARRLLAGYEPNLHRSILAQYTRELRGVTDNYLSELHFKFSAGSQLKLFPSDQQVRDGIELRPLYSNARSRWTFVLLHRAHVACYDNPKLAAKIELGTHSIEHILPQSLTEEWKTDLAEWGDDPLMTRDSYVHTLGNLTLTPINPELGQKRFAEKRLLIAKHNFPMNDSLKSSSGWKSTDIENRTRWLIDVVLKTFPSPIEVDDDDRDDILDEEEET